MVTARKTLRKSKVLEAIRSAFQEEPKEYESRGDSDSSYDLKLKIAGRTVLVECKSDSSRAPVLMAAIQLSQYIENYSRTKNPLPLLVVPFMGKVGQEICAEYGISWIDLSGNAHIDSEGLRVQIEGKPNQFRRVGRPSSVFAGRSSDVVRTLLINFNNKISKSELANMTDASKALVYRVTRKLEDQGFLEINSRGLIQIPTPRKLLDTWADSYEFSRHDIWTGHVASRSGSETLDRLAKAFSGGPKYAATGLAGAWIFEGHAGFRLATIYAEDIDIERLNDHGIRPVEKGANIQIAIPRDSGVFNGMTEINGISVVHPIQLYLDLDKQPERAKEAQESLSKNLFRK